MTLANLSTAAKLNALGRCDVFARIPKDTMGVLAEMMETESLDPGDLLFERGEPSDRVYVVVSGALSVFVEGRDEPVRRLDAGQLLGEYGMFAGQARTASVRADEPATLISMGYDRFRKFLHQFPEATFALLATAVGRLVEAERT
ncbi:MAG: cyclic nucleotide-binding domain-containing protein [Deltaproteobacteria bacterium]|jgi:CRP-like cAMP-binding protein|nr:cyclic nucleotide-binding domain-containing protein [Deltaproteobacteria bacterium]MBW2530930.1 cyclic nucleotide-binding domain-containing protein [Deltaproteobacteria bacterium]